MAFVHGSDEHDLLAATPALKDIHRLVHLLEERFDIRFARARPHITTTLRGADDAIRAWLASW